MSAAVSAALVLGVSAPATAGVASPVIVKVGQADGFSRIEFSGSEPRSARREGDELVLQFGAVAAPNLALLQADPPRYVAGAVARETASGLELRIRLAAGAEAKVGRADGASYVNISPGLSTPAPGDQKPDRARDPVPRSGVVRLHAGLEHGALSLRFDWAAPVGAAVFRRGEAIWIVFDAKAQVDASEVPPGLPQARRIDPVASANATVLRVIAPPGVQASAVAAGSSWTVTLGPTAPVNPSAAILTASSAGLSAQMAGSTGVFWLDDPSVGDRLAVVTALAPTKGVVAARRLVDADIYASAQGLALSPLTADLTVASSGDVVRIGRPSGLALSDGSPVPAFTVSRPSLPQSTSMPGLLDFEGWSRTGPGGFLARYDSLQQGAAEEGAQGRGASTQARLGLARFLVGSELSFEAIGVLDLLAKADPEALSQPEFRALRGAARAMSGRYKDAQADFSAPVLADDPASALWRGYVALRLGDFTSARQAFAAGQSALGSVAPLWRTRFAMADAEAAMGAGDLPGARDLLQTASTLHPGGVDADRLQLDLGRLAQAAGQGGDALPFYAAAEASAYGGVAAPALLYATEVQEQQGRLSPADAIGVLSSIRYRWRGDGTEVEAARALGRLYIAQGRYREALAVLKSSEAAPGDLPASAGVQADLSGAFRSLFLEGGADGLPPIQALGLFFDFKDLTPIGTDGDTMVRKLAHRLIDVDLLDQAAQLLKYQADNRLDGVGRAQVATDLALIQVMNRQPEAALDALNSSRTTLLPPDLQSRRRVIQARALTALGRYDDALEILDTDSSPDARAARAEVQWRKRDWPQAGKLMEVALGDRFKSPAPLSDMEESELLRAAIAYSLARDEAGLARLRARYGKQAETARTASLLTVALAAPQGAYAASSDAASATNTDTFAAWVAAMKARLLTSGLKAA
jgi:tetratricopeptide (TPR) repeat protein